ncbi:MAG TPA: hypothetical protein VKU85_18855, partial [bacterium]|nr:hypothetical protein [bacterium]
MRPPLRHACRHSVSFRAAVLGALAAMLLVPATGLAAPPDLRAAVEALDPVAALAPSGVLLDRAAPISRMDRFGGSPAAPPATAGALRQMADELHRASDGAIGADGLDLRRNANADAARGVIPVALLSAAYDRIRENAIDTGDLQMSDGRVTSVTAAALESRRVFAAAALRDYTLEGRRTVFRVDAMTDEPLTRLQIDFDDGL